MARKRKRYQEGGLAQNQTPERVRELLEIARQRRDQRQGLPPLPTEEEAFAVPPLPGREDEVDLSAVGEGAVEGALAGAAALPATAWAARRTVDPKRMEIEEALRSGAAKIPKRRTAAPRRSSRTARGAVVGSLQDIAEGVVRRPRSTAAAEIVGGAGAGAAIAGAEEAGGGTREQVLSGLVGGAAATVAPATALRSVQRASRWGMENLLPALGRFAKGKPAESAAKNRAARRLQGLSEDQYQSARAAREGPEGVTPARRTGEERLMSLERRILEDNPELDRQVREDLEEAARRAEEELSAVYNTTQGRRDWQQAIFERVAVPGTTIEPGDTVDMLNQAYKSFEPAYEVVKGYPVRPKLFGRRETTLDTLMGNVPKSNRVDASDEDRERVARGIESAMSAFRRRLKRSEEGDDRLAMSEDYLRLRSRLREKAREARRQGNRERATLYDIASDRVTEVLRTQLPEEPLSHLRTTDQHYRHYKTIEDAVFRATDRPLTPDRVLQAIRAGSPSRGTYARGTHQRALRDIAQGGREVREWINKPPLAREVVRGVSPEEREAIRADFVREIVNRSMRTSDDGVERVSGPRLQAEINKHRKTAQALGMEESELKRLRRIAREIRTIQQRSPQATARMLEDGPSSLMELLATWMGTASGHRMGGGMGPSQMVLSGFLARRARALLGQLTRDRAQEILIEATRDPELYSALMTRITDPLADQKRAARTLNAYLPYVMGEGYDDLELQELREESEALIGVPEIQ